MSYSITLQFTTGLPKKQVIDAMQGVWDANGVDGMFNVHPADGGAGQIVGVFHRETPDDIRYIVDRMPDFGDVPLDDDKLRLAAGKQLLAELRYYDNPDAADPLDAIAGALERGEFEVDGIDELRQAALEIQLERVGERAQTVFWEMVAKGFPEVKTGDFPPDAAMVFDESCKVAMRTWLEWNHPSFKPDSGHDRPRMKG